jgi:hypothetical protein
MDLRFLFGESKNAEQGPKCAKVLKDHYLV